MSHRNLSVFAVLVSIGAVVAACSASGDSNPDLSETPAGTEPGGAVLPPSTGQGTGSSGSSGGQADAGKDAKPKSDAAVDSGPPPPAVGASCAKADQIFARACGTQEAISIKASPSDANGAVSEYSACENELEGGCIPGAIVDESCGNCGTHKKTCTKYCAWSASACAGEPVSSCPAGTVLWTNAGCATAGTFRDRACSATCQWGNFAGQAQRKRLRLRGAFQRADPQFPLETHVTPHNREPA